MYIEMLVIFTDGAGAGGCTACCCITPATRSVSASRHAGRLHPPPWCRSPAGSTRSRGPAPRTPSYPRWWSPSQWRRPSPQCWASPPSPRPSSRTLRRRSWRRRIPSCITTPSHVSSNSNQNVFLFLAAWCSFSHRCGPLCQEGSTAGCNSRHLIGIGRSGSTLVFRLYFYLLFFDVAVFSFQGETSMQAAIIDKVNKEPDNRQREWKDVRTCRRPKRRWPLGLPRIRIQETRFRHALISTRCLTFLTFDGLQFWQLILITFFYNILKIFLTIKFFYIANVDNI